MMKRKLIFIFSGLLVGLSVGFFIGKGAHSSSLKVDSSKLNSHLKSVQTDGVKEKKMLLDALKHLDVTAEELQKAQQYIHTLEKNNKRYGWLMNFCKKNMANEFNFWGMGVGDEGFDPSPSAIEFFGWDQETVDQIKRIGKSTWNRALDWEAEAAVQVSATDGKLVYEIPALPASVKEEYLQSMKSILGEQDMKLLSEGLNEQFTSIEEPRRVEISVDSSPMSSMAFSGGGSISSAVSSGPGNMPPFMSSGGSTSNSAGKWVHIKTTNLADDSTGGGGGMFIETYEAGSNSSSNGRWSHLFNSSQLGL